MPARARYVIYNPTAGRGRAGERLSRLQQSWGDDVTFCATQYAGHAEKLAHDAAQSGAAAIIAAGGDGTVHEVANGILHAQNTDVQFLVVPLGSANDYAFSLEHGLSATATAVDVGRVRDNNGRTRYFCCCLGLGLNGSVTLESRRIRRLQGLALYGLATIRALMYHYRCPRMQVSFDDESPIVLETLMLSVLVGRREGGFVMAPDAKLDDGLMEFIHAGALSRWEVLRFLPRLALAGPPSNHPRVMLGQCRKIRLHSAAALTVHIDGEFFCKPEDDIRELEIEVLANALAVATEPLVG